MIYFENQTFVSSESNCNEYDFHNQLSSVSENNNILISGFPDIINIISPLDEEKVNSSSNNQPYLLFTTRKIKNRGRKIDNKNSKRKTHTSNFIDNTLCKLQIHFLNFLVNFSNDAIRTVFQKEQDIRNFKFKKIEHGIKRDIKSGTLSALMQNPISYVLRKKISNKYWKLSKNTDYNEQIYNQVIKVSKWLKNLFDMNYLGLFEKYYNQCIPFDSICFEGRTINFSKETKPFYSLYNELNLEMKGKIINIIKDLYLAKNKSSLKFQEFSLTK